MNNIIDIETLLEEISLEFVLGDKNDPESFSTILPLFKKLHETAKNQGIPEVAEEALRAGKTLKKILSNAIPDLSGEIDTIGMTISEIKSFIHMFSFSKTEELTNNNKETKNSFDKIPENELHSSPPQKMLPLNNIIHPGELPSCLNMDDFSEFLSAQKHNLDKMERLILRIEKDNKKDGVLEELKVLLHTMKGESGFLNLKNVEAICHITEDFIENNRSWEIVDILLEVKDWLQSTFIVYSGGTGNLKDTKQIISLLESFAPGPSTLQKPLNSPQENLTEKQKNCITKENEACGFPEPTDIDMQVRENTISSCVPVKESISVDASRLDLMIDTIGEFAIAESMVFQSGEVRRFASPELMRSINLLHKITREIQSIGMGLRMIPLKSLFYKMERVIRDLSKKTKKKVQLVVKGETTELDKNIVDKIKDPLIHLIRNSVDHGIENNSTERTRTGKPETATIELNAYHKGTCLFIEVKDDGRGIDRKKILVKALSKGLISDEEKMTDKEILNLIFHSGLSTAEKVTDVSGRGVGMDVVKKSIQACNGSVSIKSTMNSGTTCTIKIPLTLSMIDGLVARVGKERYIIPTLSVITSLKPDPAMLSAAFDQNEILKAFGKIIPIIRIHRLFDIGEAITNPSEGIVVVVEDNDRQAGLLVDQLLGKQQTVVKKLNGGMEDVKEISGGTIMPDGKVSLILDIAAIINMA